MIANLMMYARPELEEAHNRYWQLIRKHLTGHGISSPLTLSQDADEFDVWKHPQLVLSQTCGMPYRLFLHGSVNLVGTPDYGLADCAPGFYRSALITRADRKPAPLASFANATIAYNQTISQSGYAALINHANCHGVSLKPSLQTHSHLQSAFAVADGRADLAALDAVTWRLIEKYEPVASDLAVLEWTEPTPGLPYITALDPAPVFDAVSRAIAELPAAMRQSLGIRGLVKIPASEYLKVPNPPE